MTNSNDHENTAQLHGYFFRLHMQSELKKFSPERGLYRREDK